MCQALKEIFKEEFEEKLQEGFNIGMSQGISQGISQKEENLIRKKILKNKTLEQIADELETTIEEMLPIYNRVKEAMQ